MTIDCKKEILSCNASYKTELVQNKNAIMEALKNDDINITNYLNKGDKICNLTMFKSGGECPNARYGGNRTHDEMQKNIERTQAKDFLKTLKEVAQDKVSKSFEDKKEVYTRIIEEIKKELNVDLKMKAILKEKLEQNSKDAEAYNEIIRGFYENENIQSPLRCLNNDCFNKAMNDKILQINNSKDDFLDNTKTILQYINISDNLEDKQPVVTMYTTGEMV